MTEISQFEENVQLQCAVTGNPPPTVTWQRINSEGQIVPLPDATRRFANQTVYIIEVSVGSDEASYQCVATNSQGRKNQTYDLPSSKLF